MLRVSSATQRVLGLVGNLGGMREMLSPFNVYTSEVGPEGSMQFHFATQDDWRAALEFVKSEKMRAEAAAEDDIATANGGETGEIGEIGEIVRDRLR